MNNEPSVYERQLAKGITLWPAKVDIDRMPNVSEFDLSDMGSFDAVTAFDEARLHWERMLALEFFKRPQSYVPPRLKGEADLAWPEDRFAQLVNQRHWSSLGQSSKSDWAAIILNWYVSDCPDQFAVRAAQFAIKNFSHIARNNGSGFIVNLAQRLSRNPALWECAELQTFFKEVVTKVGSKLLVNGQPNYGFFCSHISRLQYWETILRALVCTEDRTLIPLIGGTIQMMKEGKLFWHEVIQPEYEDRDCDSVRFLTRKALAVFETSLLLLKEKVKP
jgi:hypothetical protein